MKINLYSNVVGINDSGAIDENGSQVIIDEAAVAIEVARLEAEYTAKEYQRNRAMAYPSIQDQLDMQYWDSVNGTTTWADAIAKVKADYPKGGE